MRRVEHSERLSTLQSRPPAGRSLARARRPLVAPRTGVVWSSSLVVVMPQDTNLHKAAHKGQPMDETKKLASEKHAPDTPIHHQTGRRGDHASANGGGQMGGGQARSVIRPLLWWARAAPVAGPVSATAAGGPARRLLRSRPRGTDQPRATHTRATQRGERPAPADPWLLAARSSSR